jgi:hypothetical protein
MIMTSLAKVAIPALGVLLLAGGIAGAVYWRGALFAEPSTGEDPATLVSAPAAAIPPIDADAPAQTETATFALG